MPVEAFPCGSRSTTSTRYPMSARAAPRLTAVVDLPTPPFWLAIAMTRATPGTSGTRGARGRREVRVLRVFVVAREGTEAAPEEGVLTGS
jgi:hypothetical protein